MGRLPCVLRYGGRPDAKEKVARPNGALVHAVLISVQICFSGWHVLAKVALNDGVNAMALAMAREGLATIIMFITARRVDGEVILDQAHILRFIWMGLMSFGNVVGSILALEYFNPTAFGVMQPSVPVFVMIMSYICGVEQMSSLKCIGVLLSVLGAILVEIYNAVEGDDMSDGAYQGGERKGSAWLGSLILLWQCASMAGLVVLEKPMLAAYPPATVTAWYYAVGSAFTLILCACCGVRARDFLLTGRIEPWIALIYVVLFGTVYTYNAYSWAVNIASPTTATVYVTLQPVSTVCLSMLFLSTVVRGHVLFGGMIIIAGLLITIYAKSVEQRGSYSLLRAKQKRELAKFFKTPGRHRYRAGGGASQGGDLSASDTEGPGGGSFDSDQDPLLSGGFGSGYDPQEAADRNGSLRRFLALG